ncbi:MAG: hypothetical protein J1E02_05220 [Coprobacter sp.]|nr:hypothetical protein [Coprobacter sp.]
MKTRKADSLLLPAFLLGLRGPSSGHVTTCPYISGSIFRTGHDMSRHVSRHVPACLFGYAVRAAFQVFVEMIDDSALTVI